MNNKIIFIDNTILNIIKLKQKFKNEYDNMLDSKYMYMLKYDDLYNILYKRREADKNIMLLNILLLKDKYIKLYVYDNITKDIDILLDNVKLDKLLNKNFKYIRLYYKIYNYKDYFYYIFIFCIIYYINLILYF